MKNLRRIAATYSFKIAPTETETFDGTPFTAVYVVWEASYYPGEYPLFDVWAHSKGFECRRLAGSTTLDESLTVPDWCPRPPEGWDQAVRDAAKAVAA